MKNSKEMLIPYCNFDRWLDACERQYRDALACGFVETAKGIQFAVKQFFVSNDAVSGAPVWCL